MRLKSGRAAYESRVEQAQSKARKNAESSLEDLVRPFLLTCNHKTAGNDISTLTLTLTLTLMLP